VRVKTLVKSMTYEEALEYEASSYKYMLMSEDDDKLVGNKIYWIKKEHFDPDRAYAVYENKIIDVNKNIKYEVNLIQRIKNCIDIKSVFIIKDNLMESMLINEPKPISWARLNKICPLCEYLEVTKSNDYFEFIKED
jgi:hypothetical protein